jgi:hypothetical protein
LGLVISVSGLTIDSKSHNSKPYSRLLWLALENWDA